MPKILTQIQTQHEHYLSLQYDNSAAFQQYATINVTGAATASTTVASPAPTAGSGKLFVAVVSSITPLTTDTVLKLGTGSAAATCTIKKYSPLDSAWVFKLDSAPTAPALATDITPGAITISGGTAGTVIELWVIDNVAGNWLDLGQNFNEGVTFTRGLTASPVARGWSATDHQKRIRAMNNWSIRQMYCSQMEGVANLRGRTIAIKDEVHTDGSANIKEVNYVMQAQVQNATTEMGAGGGDIMADMVNAQGYFQRMITVTYDEASITATA